MSDTWVRFIPTDREYVPTPEAQARAVELLLSFAPDADEVEANASEEIQFIDCGGNWMGVACPECGSDAEPWFADALNRAFDPSRFHDLMVVAPCCGAKVSLDQLKFGWPVGFARFVLEARNPRLASADLNAPQHLALEKALGCSLQIIWRHL
jgi:hypothetical protein